MADTIQEVLNWASSFLKKQNREPKIAEILILHHLHFTKIDLLMALNQPIEVHVKDNFIRDIKEHAKTGIPVQHLTGEEFFFDRRFEVNHHVLIPRPETEELIVKALEVLIEEDPKRIVDAGTGSGVIAITLKKEAPDHWIEAGDISSDALQVAKRNAERLGADVRFFESDFLQKWIDAGEQVDMIVSNPPYIAKSDRPSLQDTVRDFDPELALFANDDGLACYRQIINQSQKALACGGYLIFEIGASQAKAIKQLIQAIYPGAQIEIIQDLLGRDRIIRAKC
ncbi:peptide chain release factor N(5)-glutamine methyltransferase [Pelagirhabdus alkalitolerans]|nr:peptide chain release factor N(5)-glutamine methyltransferase [Pelagirhabdus alkalitolerans]